MELNEFVAETTLLYKQINENEVQIGDGENVSLKFPDYNGPLTIPSEIENKYITSIGNKAFYKCKITSITLPDSIKYIGEYSFQETNIAQFISPKSLISIGYYGFRIISSLKFVDLRPSKSPNFINHRIFLGSNIENALLSDDLTVISIGMFAYTKLKNITITKNIQYIEFAAFWACQNLEEFISESPYFKTFCKALYSRDLKTLIGYPCNSFVDLLPTTKAISSAKGLGATSFVKFVFNVSISIMEGHAFRECDSLEFVDMSCTKIKSIGHASFYNCPKLKQIILPETLTFLDTAMFGYAPIDILILPRNLIYAKDILLYSQTKEVAYCGIDDIPGTLPNDIIVHVTSQYQGEKFMSHSISFKDFVCPIYNCTTLITDIDTCPSVKVCFNPKLPLASIIPFILF